MTEMPPLVESPLFFLDYDGTLSEITQDPMKAFPHPDAPPLLKSLHLKHPLWIVTGRHLRDLSYLLDLDLQSVGLHGLQEGTLGKEIQTSISKEAQEAISSMRRAVPQVEGLRIEDKEYSFAAHYRGAENEEAIEYVLELWLRAMPDSLTSIWGKKVVELKPKGISKGHAVSRIMAQVPQAVPVYIGDDTTDEEAFAVLNESGRDTLSIKVGEGTTQARFRLPGVDAVIAYLKQYVD